MTATLPSEIEQARKVLSDIARISIVCLDPAMTREQVVVKVKDIYGLAVSLEPNDGELGDDE
jgi:hypothetical protein